ncbi:mitochondrial large subunit ribosomal protein-domain-containing protein [Peziza echinospora]|nr:mitochondrial large subunit ribosomal protein-domain-containing protein [Peziza echinospora]
MLSIRPFTRLFAANHLIAQRVRACPYSTAPEVEQAVEEITVEAASNTPPQILQQLSQSTTPSESIYPFRITRTNSGNLPVYQEEKKHGSWKRTRIRRIAGDIDALKDLMARGLKLDSGDLMVNMRTRHLLIRGHRRTEVLQYLKELGA